MTELKVRAERVTFGSEDLELAGEFRAAETERPQPGVVLTGPFTGVKEQVVGTYASILAAAGFATLAFDHRGFGESGGRPGHEDSQGKLADLRTGVTFLAGRAEVDAAWIAVVGISPGGGYAVRAAAADPRVKAVAGIAGGYNSPVMMLQGMGAGPYRSALAAALDQYDEYLPAVAPDGGEAAMSGEEPYAYYGNARPLLLAALAEPGHQGITPLADDVRRSERGRTPGRHPAADRPRQDRRILLAGASAGTL